MLASLAPCLGGSGRLSDIALLSLLLLRRQQHLMLGSVCVDHPRSGMFKREVLSLGCRETLAAARSCVCVVKWMLHGLDARVDQPTFLLRMQIMQNERLRSALRKIAIWAAHRHGLKTKGPLACLYRRHAIRGRS